jgi:N-ethylmaleimide reductase
LVAFGKLFINNPDLPARIKNGWDLNQNFDSSTFFGGGEKGLTDFPNHEKNKILTKI